MTTKSPRIRSLADDVTMTAEDLAERRRSEIAYIDVNWVGMNNGDPTMSIRRHQASAAPDPAQGPPTYSVKKNL